jgi:hypothetical protein
MPQRAISFQEAKSRYVHRFTMEYVPEWAKRSFHQAGTPLKEYPDADKQYPAPQYRSDQEWYENTVFPGESDGEGRSVDRRSNSCQSHSQTWPLGQRLNACYVK